MPQLHDSGEQLFVEVLFTEEATMPASASVGLYNDTTDALTDADDYAAITTEPSDGNYAPLTYTFGATDFTGADNAGNFEAQLATKQFDLTNTTTTVDAYYVAVNVQLSDDGAATDHLIWTGDLDQQYDLSSLDTGDFSSGALTFN